VDKNRETELTAIYRAFVNLLEQAQGIVHVEVVTAVPLPPALREALRSKIESSLDKTVELTLTVDKEILGGLRLRIGDRVADASVRHRLERLRELLISPVASLEGSVEAAS
jgi:F-type H+-transporting ATPase subunit delta